VSLVIQNDNNLISALQQTNPIRVGITSTFDISAVATAAASAAAASAASAAADAANFRVPTIAALKALVPVNGQTALLTHLGRQGTFIFRTGNFTARVAGDPFNGVYVKANLINDSAGAWERLRRIGECRPEWFVDDLTVEGGLNVAFNRINGHLTRPTNVEIPAGIFGIQAPIFAGPNIWSITGQGEDITLIYQANSGGTQPYMIDANLANEGFRLSDLTLGGACNTLRVTSAEAGTYAAGDIEFLSYRYRLTVWG